MIQVGDRDGEKWLGLECNFEIELVVIIGGLNMLGIPKAKGIPWLLMSSLINWMDGGIFH